MAKEIQQILKLQVEAGKANPAPPIGTMLGPTGVNMNDFCTQFNNETKERMGELVPVVLTIYNDRSFSFITKKPPASFLIKKAAGVPKGSGKNLVKKAGKLTKSQVKEIAEKKMEDLNARDISQAEKIIEGTARAMGIEIV